MTDFIEKSKTFDDIYSETDTAASLTIGSGEKSGRVSVSSPGDSIFPKGPGKPGLPDKGTEEPGLETIVLDGKTANITLGGGVPGKPASGAVGSINIKNRIGEDVVVVDGKEASLTLGSGNRPGKLAVISQSPFTDSHGQSKGAFGSLYYDGTKGTLIVGDLQMGIPGSVVVGTTGTNQSILLNGQSANISLGGGSGVGNGSINVKNRNDLDTIVLDGKDSTLTLSGYDGYSEGQDTIVLNGVSGDITAGGVGASGTVKVTNSKGEETGKMEGSNGRLDLGGNNTTGATGIISLKNSSGEEIIALDARSGNVLLGGAGASGDIFIKNENDIDTIRINGATGDIEFLNADFAEDFDVCEENIDIAKPGSVMILDENGKLALCHSEYDSKVVGIIAGAGSFKSGIVMDKNGHKNRLPIAMMGKVYCLADAETSPIQVGDMLTTSQKTGHAMKVSDIGKAFGTVIGKALSGLSQGTGLIPVLVNLQ